MPMNENDLSKRDSQRDIGAELLDAVRRVKGGDVGRVNMVPVSMAQEARQRLGLSQAQFATVLGVSKRTLQEWEQKRRQPSGAARTLIKIAAVRPEVVREALGQEAAI
jgi:putative transcriptional regulator